MNIKQINGTIHFDGSAIPAYMVDSSHPGLVQAVAAVAGDYEAAFNPSSATINGTITPDNYLDVAQADVKAFATAIYTFDNGVWADAYNAAQVTETVSPPDSPEQILQNSRNAIIADFENGVKALTSGYTDDEVKSWDAKRRESEIILSGSQEPTPTIDAIVAGLTTEENPVTREAYAQLINQKAQLYGAAYGALEATMKTRLAALV